MNKPKTTTSAERVPLLFNPKLIEQAESITVDKDAATIKIKGFTITYTRRICSGWAINLAVTVEWTHGGPQCIARGLDCDQSVREWWNALEEQHLTRTSKKIDEDRKMAYDCLAEMLSGHPDY